MGACCMKGALSEDLRDRKTHSTDDSNPNKIKEHNKSIKNSIFKKRNKKPAMERCVPVTTGTGLYNNKKMN